METKANYVLIGAFTIAGFLGMLGFLMWFAKLQIDRQFAYYDVYFTEVGGLSISSDVQFAGLRVGTVVDMQLAPDAAGPVRVRVEVAEDTPVRSDSSASLVAQGVTGVSNVAISAGTASAPLLRDTSDDAVPVIPASRSALQALSDEGPEMLSRLNQVAEQLTELLGEENQTRVENILTNVEHSTANLDQAMDDISSATEAIGIAAEGIARFGEQMHGLGETADAALQQFTQAATTADGTLQSATATLDELRDYVSGDLRGLTQRLDETAASLQSDVTRLADRAGTSLDKLDETLGVGDAALESANRAFDGADRVLNNDLGPVIADFRVTLGNLNEAIASVSDDLPQITASLRDAADSAERAFASLRSMVDGASGPVRAFTRDALPQFTRMSVELRGLVDNLNQLVTALRRNPAQIFTGPNTPEFRR